MMFCSVYWNRTTGDVLVSPVAKTEAGFWLDVEPVGHASADDPSSILKALEKAVKGKGTVIPTPARAAFPKPVVLAHTSARNWSDFERRHSQFSVAETLDGGFEIKGYRRASDGPGVEADPTASKVLPPGTALDGVVVELISLTKK